MYLHLQMLFLTFLALLNFQNLNFQYEYEFCDKYMGQSIQKNGPSKIF